MLLHDLFRASAARSPHRTAVVTSRRRVSYAQLEAMMYSIAAALRAGGVTRHKRVVLFLPNDVETAAAIWAVLHLGGIFVVLNASLKSEALCRTLDDCEPDAIITHADLLRAHIDALSSRPACTCQLVIGAVEEIPGWQPCAVETDAAPVAAERVLNCDLAAFIYTSGSSGEPKGVMLTHLNMVSALTSVNEYLQVNDTDVIYSPLPLGSSYGLYQLLLGLSVGASVVLDRSFVFLAASLRLMEVERATVLAAVPLMVARIIAYSRLQECDLASLRIITTAGSALPHEHALRIRELLPQARLFIMYGQTECKRISYLPPEDIERKPGSVGRGMLNQEVFLLDDEGRRLPPGSTGELAVRGPHVMAGYWRKPEETQAKLLPGMHRADVILRTGDQFYMDEEGYLYFRGRKDELLKVGGEKVSPAEIENAIYSMPGVQGVAVVGMPDPEWGEVAKAYVMPFSGVQIEPQEVIRHCSTRLRGIMVPRQVVIVAELPKTDSGKIRKRDLA